MPPVSTPAIVLHAFRYSESSKVVRLLTKQQGVVSAVAKGAERPKSKFGARLQLLSEGVAQLYLKPNRDLQTLAEFDVVKIRQELASDMRRYASAAALSELVLRFSPAEPNEDVYARFVTYLDSIAFVEQAYLETVSLSTLWGIVCALGFEPALVACARDGRRLPEGNAVFSVSDGGLLCSACAGSAESSQGVEAGTVPHDGRPRGEPGSSVRGTFARLQGSDRAALEHLIAGRCEEVGVLSSRHASAHRRLLMRFVDRHVREDHNLKALSFWESLPWDATS